MNYIAQINLLHQIRQKDSLGPLEIALHVVLLDICNSYDWENPFTLKNDRILSDLDVTFKTMAAARNKLSQAGLIRFKTKNGSPVTVYQILKPEECKTVRTSGKFTKVWDEVQDEVRDEVRGKVTGEVGGSDSSIYINQTKQKKKKPDADGKHPRGTKKVKEEKPKAVYTQCMDIYHDWFKHRYEVTPMIDGLQGRSLKSIIEYIRGNVLKRATEENIVYTEEDLNIKISENFKWLLDNWDKLEEFLQKQTKLNQISSNLQNIIVQIKKHSGNANKGNKNGGGNSTPIWRRQPENIG